MDGNKLQEVVDATVDALVYRLREDEPDIAAIKLGIEFMKNMKVEANYVPGTQPDKVEAALKDVEAFPKFA